MAVRLLCLICVLVVLCIVNAEIDQCTTIVVGPKAGVEGPMCTHTADCLNCDFRLSKVPSRYWAKDTPRPLYIYKGDYPATVSNDRGETWKPSNLEGTPEQLAAWGKESTITGYIPQVFSLKKKEKKGRNKIEY